MQKSKTKSYSSFALCTRTHIYMIQIYIYNIQCARVISILDYMQHCPGFATVQTRSVSIYFFMYVYIHLYLLVQCTMHEHTFLPCLGTKSEEINTKNYSGWYNGRQRDIITIDRFRARKSICCVWGVGCKQCESVASCTYVHRYCPVNKDVAASFGYLSDQLCIRHY